MGLLPQAAASDTLVRVEPSAMSDRPARPWAVVGFPVAVVALLLLGAMLVYVLFVQTDSFNEWFAVKPGILVEMTAERGKLQVQPFEEISSWYEWSVNFHSNRWAATILFLDLHDVTGLEMRELSVAPFGIVVYLLALLFLFLSVEPGAAGRWGFLLSALLLLFSWSMLGWVFHSGGWPGTAMGVFSLGLLYQSSRQQRHKAWLRGMAILFLFIAFGYYHAMAVLLTFLLPTLFIYHAVASPLSHRSGRPASTSAFAFFNLAAITVAWFFLDPLFAPLVGETGVTRPWEGLGSFYTSIFQRGGDLVPYQRGYSASGRVMIMLPLVSMLLASAWFWARTHLVAIIRGHPLSGGQIITGALFLTVPFLAIGGMISGTGSFRYPEMYLLLLLSTPLLLVQWLFSKGGPSRGVVLEGAVVAVSLLVITFASFAVLAREPISRWGYLDESDVSAAAWAASNIREPYFADNFTTGLILMENRASPIVPLGGSIVETGEVLYNGPDRFAEGLRYRGAAMALLSGRSMAPTSSHDSFRALKTTDFFIDPIPNYDFGVAPYARIYDDGRNVVITLGEPTLEP